MATKCEERYKKYNVVEGMKLMNHDNLPEIYLNNVWRANMSITGAGGLPDIATAGNVVRPSTSVRCSVRLPPVMKPSDATAIITKKLTENVPYGAKVTVKGGHEGSGWCQKGLDPWLDQAMSEASVLFFDGKETAARSSGGSIPFLNKLENLYPSTQIVALGVLGPKANAHAPNECINLVFAKKLTCCLSHMIGAIGQH